MFLSTRVHAHLLDHRQHNQQTVATVLVCADYSDWIQKIADALDIEFDDCMNAVMALEAQELIFVITDTPESSFVDYVEVRD